MSLKWFVRLLYQFTRTFVPSRREKQFRWKPLDRLCALRSQLDQLEDRTAPAIFTVLNTNDSGAASLRQAITNANTTGGADQIQFTIGTGLQTIAPLSALPTITEAVTIDATTQPGFAGAPIIELRGDSAGASVDGMTITGSGARSAGS